jgi:sporulation protein YlmC with PRC-barrel domain
MTNCEVQLEQLLGRVVRTAAGRPVGRIEEVRVRPDGDDYIVDEFVIGELGLLAKLSAIVAQLPTLKALGLPGRYRTRAIPWSWLDLSDFERPRFRSSVPERES